MTYNPTYALFVFSGISVILLLIFWPNKGLYSILKKSYQNNDRTAIEDILKLLYHNQISDIYLNTNGITNSLNYRNSLLIESINRMLASDLIYMEGDTIKLSKSGNEYALRIVRAHRLWEKFLSEKTGFESEEWHKRAERKEHELNLEETNRLSALLGNPKFDPHGDPIPTSSGKISLKKGLPLSTLKADSVGRIIHIEDEPNIIYKQILAANIYLDSQIHVIENNATRVVFHSEGEKFVLAPIVAGNITVAILEKTSIKKEDIARLSSLKVNETAKIIGLSKECRGENRRRLLDLGFVKGASVSIDLLNPLGDPKAFSIKGTAIALRNNQASKILIKKD